MAIYTCEVCMAELYSRTKYKAHVEKAHSMKFESEVDYMLVDAQHERALHQTSTFVPVIDGLEMFPEPESLDSMFIEFETKYQTEIPSDLKLFAALESNLRLADKLPRDMFIFVPDSMYWNFRVNWNLCINPHPEHFMVKIMESTASEDKCFWYCGWKQGDTFSRVYVNSVEAIECDSIDQVVYDKKVSAFALTCESTIEFISRLSFFINECYYQRHDTAELESLSGNSSNISISLQ